MHSMFKLCNASLIVHAQMELAFYYGLASSEKRGPQLQMGK